jgi:hypothetical protein
VTAFVVVVVVVGAVVVEVFVEVPEEVVVVVVASLDDAVPDPDVPDPDVPDPDVLDADVLDDPGCSPATTAPISAIAPAAPRTAHRVTRRSRTIARSRASGEFSFDRFMGRDLVCGGLSQYQHRHFRAVAGLPVGLL